MHNSKTPSTILGFDFGMSRIGVAIGDSLIKSAKPLTTLQATDGIPLWGEIEALVNKWDIRAMVVGMPYALDHSFQEITFAARKFSNRLKQKFKLPVHLIDESYTTKIARMKKRSKKIGIDSVAASVILQAWFNENKNK
jgi:putative holliday junction resolvase